MHISSIAQVIVRLFSLYIFVDAISSATTIFSWFIARYSQDPTLGYFSTTSLLPTFSEFTLKIIIGFLGWFLAPQISLYLSQGKDETVKVEHINIPKICFMLISLLGLYLFITSIPEIILGISALTGSKVFGHTLPPASENFLYYTARSTMLFVLSIILMAAARPISARILRSYPND